MTAYADAGALEIDHIYNGIEVDSQKAYISLVITPNRMLDPWCTEELSYTGTVTRRRCQKIAVRLPKLGSIKFDHYYDWHSSEDKSIRQSHRYLVASLRFDLRTFNSEGMLKEIVAPIEDILLLASFGSRTPTRCAGWIVSDSSIFTQYYRRHLWLPQGKQRHKTSINGGLVELADFERFLNHTISVFQKSDIKREIRQAIFALDNSSEETIERRFVSLYSAFEGLVDGLIQNHLKERFTTDKKQRQSTINKLLKLLDQWYEEKIISEELRRQFAKQIKGVQSISLSEKYKILDTIVAFQHKDLWPIIGQGKIMSLYRIRNLIVHGSSLEERHLDGVVNANSHIEWLLERLLCAIFRWPLEKTDISHTSLLSYWSHELVNWKLAAKSFDSPHEV